MHAYYQHAHAARIPSHMTWQTHDVAATCCYLLPGIPDSSA